MAISKIKLPNNSTQDLHDSRIPGVDTTVTSGSSNVVTSGAVSAAISNVAVTSLTTSEIDTIWGGGTVSG